MLCPDHESAHGVQHPGLRPPAEDVEAAGEERGAVRGAAMVRGQLVPARGLLAAEISNTQ